MNVKELKEFLEKIPDDYTVKVEWPFEHEEFVVNEEVISINESRKEICF